MTYTFVPKPTTRNYTNTNPQGKEQYDQVSILYDDPNIFYDGVNMSQYTKVAKPVGIFTLKPGMATGLIMSPTYPQTFTQTAYVKVAKPT